MMTRDVNNYNTLHVQLNYLIHHLIFFFFFIKRNLEKFFAPGEYLYRMKVYLPGPNSIEKYYGNARILVRFWIQRFYASLRTR